MSEFTREKPFEFEGVKVWRRNDGLPGWHHTSIESDEGTLARALHAFIEAERDSWHYTNDDHTEARKGRWTVRESMNDTGFGVYRNWTLTHDDFPTFPGIVSTHSKPTSKSKPHYHLRLSWWVQMRDFLAWHAAQNQPAEPTGLGAVVEVNGLRYTRVPWHDGDNKPWMQEGDCWNWSQFTSRGPVTVLSPGVES